MIRIGKTHVGPVDLHWRVYVDDECIGEARKLYGARGRGNEGFRWDVVDGTYSNNGYEPTLAKAIAQVLMREDDYALYQEALLDEKASA